jgi:hypothetical protein
MLQILRKNTGLSQLISLALSALCLSLKKELVELLEVLR